jgi:diaminopimelate epimerase
MRFVKYHGCGNDFVIVSEAELARAGYFVGDGDALGCAPGDGADEAREGLPALARRLCHRCLGVGADGLIVCRTDPLTMDIINSDGSVAPMCGNGIRCFARYCIEEGIVSAGVEAFDVHTLAGIMRVRVSFADGFTAEVDMGRPDWSAPAAGIGGSYAGDGEAFIGRKLNVDVEASLVRGDCSGDAVFSHEVKLSSFFLGTYHTVVWLDENGWILGDGADRVRSLYGSDAVCMVGRALESHPAFTERTNVDFARITGRNVAEMITWERGAGLTAACGTGACSVAALGVREGRFDGGAEVRVMLPHGELFIRQGESGEVFMRGPAARVFDGKFYL